jgi:hypothetical protein
LVVSSLFKKPAGITISKRRELTQSPAISVEAIFNGSFREDYRDFLQDRAVLREDFRVIIAFIKRMVLLKKENDETFF